VAQSLKMLGNGQKINLGAAGVGKTAVGEHETHRAES
jgi:hypothetical protein